MPDPIFDSALLSMCMTWRHDFGLLDRKEQMAVRRELIGLYEHHVKPAIDRASSAESSLAAMRQRAEEAEEKVLFWKGESESLRLQKNSYAGSLKALRFERDAAVRERDALQSEYNKVYDALGLEQQRADSAELERDAACEALQVLEEGFDAIKAHGGHILQSALRTYFEGGAERVSCMICAALAKIEGGRG